MATKYYVFVGKAAWPKLVRPDEGPYGKKWMIDLYPDEDNLCLIEDSGVKINPIKASPTFPGEIGYRFKRDVEKVINGKMTQFEPPKVVDKDNNEFTENIGNGSIVECEVAVYDTRAGKGHRLNTVRVLEHVPYVGQETIRVGTKTAVSPKTKKVW